MESAYIISLVVHLAHSEEMHTAVAYGSYGMDKLLNGEPAVAKSICGTESGFSGTPHHRHCTVGLLHIQLLIPYMVWIIFVTLLGELTLTLLVTQTAVLFLAFLTVQREVHLVNFV